MARRIRDAFPFIPPAGKVELRGTEPIIAADADVPPTPTSIAPYRKSRSRQPGQRSLHYGIARDPPPPNIRFGRRAEYNVSAADCLYDPTAIGVAAVANEQAERVYATRTREPLGRVPSINRLPAEALEPTFVFGNKSNKSERAKDVIYGTGISEDVAAPENSRVQPVGVTKDRKYDWASVNIDPTKHRFGRSTLNVVEDVRIKPTLIAPLLPKYRRPPMTAGFEKFDKPYEPTTSNFALVDIGDTREEGLGHPHCPSATLRKLRSQSSTPSESASRVFGVPTVRNDIPRPKEIRFANANNYGDDATAGVLLNPSKATGAFAIDERDYDVPMKPEAVERTIRAAQLPEDVAAKVKEAAAAAGSSVTARSLRQAMIDAGY